MDSPSRKANEIYFEPEIRDLRFEKDSKICVYPESEKTSKRSLTKKQAAKGCILGAFTGDAAGAFLEFYHKQISKEDVKNALKFPGGGVLMVEPGQFTDDSEMAMCLMHGLIEGNGVVDQSIIAKWYLDWYKSPPFDIGYTTKCAMRSIEIMIEQQGTLEECINSINEYNKKSQSNGCLMRTTPLAVFCHKLDDIQIYECTKKDVNLTHTHEIAILATTCYNIAIAHLLNNLGDAKGAIERVDNYVKFVDNSEFNEHWTKILEAKDEDDLIRADRLIGFIIIAFSYAFFYLKKDYTYENAIRSMLLRGGDTDTNAAIVGGLLGARHGINEIPAKWRKAVLNCKNSRPKFLQIESKSNLDDLTNKLLKIAPGNIKDNSNNESSTAGSINYRL